MLMEMIVGVRIILLKMQLIETQVKAHMMQENNMELAHLAKLSRQGIYLHIKMADGVMALQSLTTIMNKNKF